MKTNLSQIPASVAGWIDENAHTFALKIGLWVMTFPSATLLGYTLRTGAIERLNFDPTVSDAIGIFFTIGAISLGSVTSRNAIKRGGIWIALIGLEVLTIMSVFLILEGTTNLGVLGIACEFLAVLSYVAQSGVNRSTEEKQEKQSDFELQREMELKKLELQHAEKLARIEANKEAKIAQSSVQSTVQSTVQSDDVSRLEQAILNILLNGQRLNITQLAEQYNCSRNTVYSRLNDLVEVGKVHKNGNGWELNGQVQR